MTAQNQAESLQQLSETVAQLTAVLAANERRRASLARTMRWSALAFVVLVVGVGYAVSETVLAAYERQVPPWWIQGEKQMASAPPGLDGVMQSLMGTKEIQGALVKILQSATQVATEEMNSYIKCYEERADNPTIKDEICFAEASVEDLGEYFLNADGKLPPPPNTNDPRDPEYQAYMKELMQGALMAAGQVVVDASTLVHRLRRDSDVFRGTVSSIGGTQKLLRGIRHELHLMNGMLASIPVMTNEVHAMNRQMSVMTYSMGSTMGRMGNMMPW